MDIRNLEQLKRIKLSLEEQEQDNKEITLSNVITGGSKSVVENKKMFFYNFDREDLDEYLDIIQQFSQASDQEKYKRFFLERLQRKNKEMLYKKLFPLECLLYASRVVSKRIEEDEDLVDLIVGSLQDMNLSQLENQENIAETLKNIFTVWDWEEQILIALMYCGVVAKDEILGFILSDEIRRRLLKLHPTKGKYYMVKMLLAIKNSEYSDDLINLLLDLQEGEKKIFDYVNKNYISNGFDKEKINANAARGSGYFKKLCERILQEKIGNNNAKNELDGICNDILNDTNTNSNIEKVNKLISKMSNRVFSESDLYKILHSLSRNNRRKNNYLGIKLAEYIEDYSGKKKGLRVLAYKTIAHHIGKSQGEEFFHNKLLNYPEDEVDILVSLYLLDDSDNENREMILEACTNSELNSDDLRSISYLFNYKKQLYEMFLSRVLKATKNKDDKVLANTLSTWQGLLDCRDSLRIVDKPVILEIIKAIGLYLNESRDDRLQQWGINIISMLKKDGKIPKEVIAILSEMSSNPNFSAKIRAKSEEIVKKNTYSERPN